MPSLFLIHSTFDNSEAQILLLPENSGTSVSLFGSDLQNIPPHFLGYTAHIENNEIKLYYYDPILLFLIKIRFELFPIVFLNRSMENSVN